MSCAIWDYQSIDYCKGIDEYEIPTEVIIRRIELECIDEGFSGCWMSPPDPPTYAPKWEEMIIVRPVYKWFGRSKEETQ